MRRLRLAFVGAIVFLIGMIYHLPASQVVPRMLPAGTPVSVHGLEGRLLGGGADHVYVGGIRIGSLTWELHPSRLLVGRLSADVSVSGLADVEGTVWAGLSDWGVDSVDGEAQLSDLKPFLRAVPADIRGRVTASGVSIRLVGASPSDAGGSASLSGLSLAAPFDLQLGDYTAAIEAGPDRSATARIRDAGGPLSVQGEAKLAEGGAWTVDLRIEPRPDAATAIREGLRFVAQPLPRGGFRLQQRGQVPLTP